MHPVCGPIATSPCTDALAKNHRLPPRGDYRDVVIA